MTSQEVYEEYKATQKKAEALKKQYYQFQQEELNESIAPLVGQCYRRKDAVDGTTLGRIIGQPLRSNFGHGVLSNTPVLEINEKYELTFSTLSAYELIRNRVEWISFEEFEAYTNHCLNLVSEIAKCPPETYGNEAKDYIAAILL